MKIAARLLLMLLILAAIAIWWLSRVPLLVVGGSDATAIIIEPDRTHQFVALVLLVLSAASCLPLRGGRAARIARGAILAVALSAFALAMHRLVIDGGRAQIGDIWALATVQTIGSDPQDGLGVDPKWSQSDYFVTFQRSTGETMNVFLGIGPLRLNTAPLHALPR